MASFTFQRYFKHAGISYRLVLARQVPFRRPAAIYCGPLTLKQGGLSREFKIIDCEEQILATAESLAAALRSLFACQTRRPKRIAPPLPQPPVVLPGPASASHPVA